jgi:hypothetical protein
VTRTCSAKGESASLACWKERVHLEELRAEGRIILKWIIIMQGKIMLTGLIWLTIGTGCGLM